MNVTARTVKFQMYLFKESKVKYLSFLVLAFPLYGYALPHHLSSGSVVFRDCTVIGSRHTAPLTEYEVIDEKNRFTFISTSGIKYQSPLLISASENQDLLEGTDGDGYYSRLRLEPSEQYIYSYKSRTRMIQIICSISARETDEMIDSGFQI